jgi:phage/plasmid-like protein (TIGR03299 family)
MQTTEHPTMRLADATSAVWLGSGGKGWGDVVRQVGSSAHTAAEAVEAAGLDWHVEQHPIEAVIEGDTPRTRLQVPRVVANVRSDTRAVLGVVGCGYTPLQNRDAFALADALVDSGNAHWLGAGATRGGAHIHALMRLDREVRIGDAEGEDILPLLLLRNGHDGGLAVTVSVAPFRLVCLNGMLLHVDGAARTWKARHTPSVRARLTDARRTLDIAWRYYDELERLGDRLIRERLTPGDFEHFLAHLVPLPDARPDETRGGRAVQNAQRVREAIRTAYLTTPDLDPVRGTRWGALQAVTAYHDHHARVRTTAGRTLAEARFERATTPARLKDRALELLAA